MRRAPAHSLDVGPLVDVMCTLLVLLVGLALAVEPHALHVEQGLATPYCGPPHPAPRPPPLTVHLTASYMWIGRDVLGGSELPRRDGAVDTAWFEARIAEDRARFRRDREVVVVTDDGVAYGEMITALDLARAYGYDQPLLGGGPPAPVR